MKVNYHFFLSFLVWTIFKVFIEFFRILLMFYILVFWWRGMWDLSSQTRNQTCAPCNGGWSLKHWTSREVLNYYCNWYFLSVENFQSLYQEINEKFPEARGRILLGFCGPCGCHFEGSVYTAPLGKQHPPSMWSSLILYFLIGCCLKQQEYILRVHYKAILLNYYKIEKEWVNMSYVYFNIIISIKTAN